MILRKIKNVADTFFSTGNHSRIPLICSILFLLVCIVQLFSPAIYGGALPFPPDCLEYSMGCDSLWKTGRLGIWLDGKFQPSRYLPWFSAMVCLPFVRLFSGDIMSAVYAIWFYASASLVLIFIIAKRNGTWMSGLCSAALLFLSPNFTNLSQIVMTEIPHVFFLLLMFFIWLELRKKQKFSWGLICLYALFTACAGAIRISAFPMLILPWWFVMQKEALWKKKIAVTAVLLFPSVLVLCGTFLYNYAVFGSVFRNGYQYWCSVPYDYPSLTFSFRYIEQNIKSLLEYSFFPVIAVKTAIIVWLLYIFSRKPENYFPSEKKNVFTAEVTFAMTQGVILLLLYLPYFFPGGGRFSMPFEVLLIIPAVTAIELFFFKKKFLLYGVMICLLCVGWGKVIHYQPTQFQSFFVIEQLKHADRFLPPDAVVISDDHCALAEYYFVKKTLRRYIPFSRNQEYVGKVLAPKSIRALIPAPKSLFEHSASTLRKSPHCLLPYLWTVQENPEKLCELLQTHDGYLLQYEYQKLCPLLKALFPTAYFKPIKAGSYQCWQLIL